MLIALHRFPAAARPNDPVREGIAVAISAALHAAAIGLLLLRPGREMPSPTPPLEIELVQQQAEQRGAPPPPAPTPTPETPPIPQVPAPAAAALPSTPSPPTKRQTPPQRSAPEVNLGNAAQDLDPLSVTGDNVVPPGPDARYRNLPPHYPAAAARIGAEGTVQLVARIAPNGLPVSVGVVESSGNVDLDEEARRAVLLWRFRPTREGGRAVAYDYVVNIRFALGDR